MLEGRNHGSLTQKENGVSVGVLKPSQGGCGLTQHGLRLQSGGTSQLKPIQVCTWIVFDAIRGYKKEGKSENRVCKLAV